MIKTTRVADYRLRLVATVSIAFALAFSAAGFASWRTAIEEGSAAGGLPLSCSFGWALSRADDSPALLVSRADEGMYLAKKRGRNRVESVE